MYIKIRGSIVTVLIILLLSACGGSGGDGSSAIPVSEAKTGLIIETDVTESPYIYISPEGNTYTYSVDPVSGQPTSLTVSTVKGDEIYVSINETTGNVDYWAHKGYIVYFGNYRAASGLVDIALIDPQDTTQYFYDVAYKPADTVTSKLLLSPDISPILTTPATANRIMAANAGGWPAFFNAFGVTVSAAICGGDAIVALGGAATLAAGEVAALTFPVSIPVLVTAGGVALLCAGKTALAIKAMVPETKVVKSRDVDAATLKTYMTAENLNEVVGFSGNTLVPNTAACLQGVQAKSPLLLKDCLLATVDAISLLGTSTLQRLIGSYRAAQSLIKDKTAKGVFCCDGPAQVKPSQLANWKAIVLGGPNPVDNAFDFGDPPGINIADFVSSTDDPLTASHTYGSSGDYLINVSARLTGTDITKSKNFPVRVYDDLMVNCCTATGTLLADGTTFKTGSEITLGITVTGGKQPYLYEFDFDAGNTASIHGINVISVHVAYDNPGLYSTFVKVTDAENTVVTSQVRTLEVDNASTVSGSIDFVASMCPATFPNGSLLNPEQLTFDGFTLQPVPSEGAGTGGYRSALCKYRSADGQQTPFLAIEWFAVNAPTSPGTDICGSNGVKTTDPYWFETFRQASSQSRAVSARWAGFFTNKTIIEQAVKKVVSDAVTNNVGVACQ